MAGNSLLGNYRFHHARQPFRATSTKPEAFLRLLVNLASGIYHVGRDQRNGNGYDRIGLLRAGIHALQLSRIRGNRYRGTSLRQDHDRRL